MIYQYNPLLSKKIILVLKYCSESVINEYGRRRKSVFKPNLFKDNNLCYYFKLKYRFKTYCPNKNVNYLSSKNTIFERMIILVCFWKFIFTKIQK